MLQKQIVETIEIKKGKVICHTHIDVYENDSLLVDGSRDRHTQRITPGDSYEDLPPIVQKLFDALFDEQAIDEYFDERVALVERDGVTEQESEGEIMNRINQRRAAAKAARQQRQRQKQNRP